jgi:hypothetical protein
MRLLVSVLPVLIALGCRGSEPSTKQAGPPGIPSTRAASADSGVELTGLSSEGLLLSWSAPPGAHAGTIYHVSVDTGWTWQGTGTRVIYGTTETPASNVSRSFPALDTGSPVRWVVVAFADDGTILAMSEVTELVRQR